MKHLRDLTVAEAQLFIDTPAFLIGEKLDGSYFEFGRDEDGFYTKTKAPKKYRAAAEYTEYYHNAFRAAHIVAETWYASWKDKIPATMPIQAEVFGTYMPNVVEYAEGQRLIITSDLTMYDLIFEDTYIKVPSVRYQTSTDGKTIDTFISDQDWCLEFNPLQWYTPYSTGVNIIKDGIKNDNRIADLPLNKKLPEGVTKEAVLLARDAFKAYMKFASDLILNEINNRKVLYLQNVSKSLPYEGVVFRYGPLFDQCVKIVHPEFKIHNAYYHIWQDRLIGPDYSFKQFAADPRHTQDQKVAELDRLLAKYQRNPYTADAVHSRTLLLFAEERKRLDGR